VTAGITIAVSSVVMMAYLRKISVSSCVDRPFCSWLRVVTWAAILGQTSLHASLTWAVPQSGRLTYSAIDPMAAAQHFIVSDIDDTVKLTDVDHKPAALARAALSEKAFAGMSTLYQEISEQNERSTVYFVSGSPEIFRRSLTEMLAANEFPGPWVLTLRDLSMPTREFKTTKIKEILDTLPLEAKLILVGDDGEADPEIYATILQKYPDRVAGVYIHRIKGRALPSDVVPYDTAMDIALREMEIGHIRADQAIRVGKAVLSEGRRDSEKLVLKYNFCPDSFESYRPQSAFGKEREAYELNAKIQERIQSICKDRAGNADNLVNN
jgi:hypothetical protein